MHLPADSPGEWLARHVCTHLTAADRARALPTSHLLAGGRLRLQFSRIRQDDPRRLYHVTELSAWYAGTIAMELGYAYAGAAAGFLPTAGQVRWVLHDDGWAEGLVFAADTRAVVLPGHPWQGRPDVAVAHSRTELLDMTMKAVVRLAAPIVEHLVVVTGAGRSGLWHEVSDAFPRVLTWDGQIPVTARLVDDFTAMLARPALPWKRRPTLELLDTDWGPVCVEQRGGCCMAYVDPAAGRQEADPDESHSRYHADLPEPAATRRYCLDCKFRTYHDSRARQVWWRRNEASVPATS